MTEKKKKGTNDRKKGNRTPGQPRNGKGLAAISKQQALDYERYREQAEKMRAKRKYTQEQVFTVYERLCDYIRKQEEEERPFTIAGMIRAAGVSKATWYEMLGGNYDTQLYAYMDLHNIPLDVLNTCSDEIPVIIDEQGEQNVKVALITWSEMLQKAVLRVEEQTEERLYAKGRVGEIFALKALHNWKEEAPPQTVNQTLVIASEEQARKAINLLK